MATEQNINNESNILVKGKKIDITSEAQVSVTQKETVAGKAMLERTTPPFPTGDVVAGNISMSIWSIESAKRIAAILKLAQEACRAASYSETGGNHVTKVRKLLMQFTGTTPWDEAGIAKNIIDEVKGDLAQ